MINEEAKMYIDAAIEKEKNAAIEKHSYFNSNHEFWAVIKEEIEELEYEFEPQFLDKFIRESWLSIKADKGINQSYLQHLKTMAKRVAVEAVQVAAVINKYSEGVKDVNGKTKES